MNIPRRDIPPERKAMYYGGMALSGVGLVLFLSVFVTFFINFGNFDNFEGQARSSGFRAFGGIILLMAGGFLMNIGRRGWSGSGVLLDPQQARKDVAPWSRMSGGVTQDALSEIEIVKKLEKHLDQPEEGKSPPEQQIFVRCQQCRALNDETAKFCDQCGTAL